jgi:hypothetical protein
MSAYSGPEISNDGLILCLDAANQQCFNPGDSFCRNLVTGGLVTGAAASPLAGTHTPNTLNFPSHSSLHGGIFDFAGGRGMNCEENLGFRTTTSLCIWFYKPNSGIEYITDGRNNGGKWFLTNYGGRNIVYDDALVYNYDDTYDTNSAKFLNNWQHMVVTSENAGSKLYLNGQEVLNYVAQNSIDEDFGINFRIGTRYTTGNQWSGYMGVISAYERVLTPTEVQQNFNALRSRYDI